MLIPGGSNPIYVSSGYLVHVFEEMLWAVRFDPERLEVMGRPFPLGDERMQNRQSRTAHFGISRNGTLVYSLPVKEADRILAWIDRTGAVAPLDVPPAAYWNPSLSQDGKKVVLGVVDESGDNIAVLDVRNNTLSKRTFGGYNGWPIWSSDGAEIFYTSDFLARVMRVPADGSGRPEPLGIELAGYVVPTSWSDIHRTLLFEHSNDTWEYSVEKNAAAPFLSSDAYVRQARFSPDQNWVAFRSDETGRDEIFVVPFPYTGGGKRQVSTDGGVQPMWSPTGGELFYRSGRRMMAVTVRFEPTFTSGVPRTLFESPTGIHDTDFIGRYAVSPDGGAFLVLVPVAIEPRAAPKIHVVVNWLLELDRIAPAED